MGQLPQPARAAPRAALRLEGGPQGSLPARLPPARGSEPLAFASCPLSPSSADTDTPAELKQACSCPSSKLTPNSGRNASGRVFEDLRS